MPGHSVLTHYGAAARLLIVDDERDVRSPLTQIFSSEGYFVDDAGSGREALALLERASYDLMVLDMRLPDMNGVEVMLRARQIHPELLIIVLTSHATLENAITAVRAEAADYLRKPLSVRVIIDSVTRTLQKKAARLHREHLVHVMSETVEALRHVETTSIPSLVPGPKSEHLLQVHPLKLDCVKRQVTVGDNLDQTFQLTDSEVAVLHCLMASPDQVFSCRQLVRKVWKQDLSEVQAGIVIRPYISRLRHKLEADPRKPRLICTVRKGGYYFVSAKKTSDQIETSRTRQS